MARFVNVTEQDLAAGVDFLSAESAIPEGYAEDIVNFDAVPEGYLTKRPGTQGVYGNIPVRVQSFKYAASGELTFYLDGSVDLGKLPVVPLVVYGKTSVPTGPSADFDEVAPQVQYYSDFSTQVRRTFVDGGTPQTMVIPGGEIDLNTPFVWTGVGESTSPADFSHSLFTPNAVEVNQSTNDISLGYTNSTGADFSGFVYYLDASPSPGDVFVSSPTAVPAGSNTYTITAATHALSTSFIIPKVMVDNGTSYSEVVPDSLAIATNGDVTIGITNSTGVSFNVVFMLTSALAANRIEGVVDSAASVPVGPKTLQVTVSPDTPFNFFACYLMVGASRELVLPESIEYDAASGQATITFINASPSANTFELYWVPAVLPSNRLVVATGAPIPLTVEDSRPELTIWGLDHAEIYASTDQRQGWVTHLDSYRSEGERFLVSGLGGNLFKGQTRTADTASQYLIPSLAPSLRARASATVSIGPTFIDSTDMPFRTNGHIQGDNLASGWAQIEQFAWEPGVGMVVTMNIPGLSLSGVPTDIINTTAGFEDKAVIRQAPYGRLNGSYTILDWDMVGTLLTITLDMPQIDSSDWDDAGGVGQLGLFSDRFELDITSPFIPGDTPICDAFANIPQLVVSNSDDTTLILDQATDQANIPGGIRIAGARTGAVIPLRTATGIPTNEGFVRGDMVSLSGYNQEFRVLSVNGADDQVVGITGDGTTTTLVLGGNTANTFYVGQKVLLLQAGDFSGEHVVSSVSGVDTLLLDSTTVGTTSGLLAGHVIELDEAIVWTDNVESTTSATVTGRWVPFEAPTDDWNLTPNTYVRYFDESTYANQPFLRSVMANDSLFVTNGIDRPQKVDGVNIYRPGLPRWQAQLYVSVATNPDDGGVIAINPVTTSYTGSQNNYFVVSLADSNVFQIGARIRDSIDGEVYTVTSLGDDNTNAQIYVDRNVTSTFAGTPALSQLTTYRYYFRLNAVDINNNLVASAATGSQDCVIELTEDAQVRIRIVGLPVLDNFDYDRVELEVYRTQSTGEAPFYRLTTLPLDFDNTRGYIDYVDTDSDEDLSDLDVVNTALKGAELGTTWSDPLRAKSITSIGNSLVLANFKSDPYLMLNFVDKGVRVTPDELDGFRLLLKRDSGDALTDSDMLNRVALEFVTDSASVTAMVPTTDAVTITSTAHGLAVGDWVYLFRAAAPGDNLQTHLMGHWQVASIPTADTFTVNFVANGLGALVLADEIDAMAKATLSGDVPVYLGEDFNYGWSRQEGSDVTGPYERLAVLRAANALNSTMRQTDITITGYGEFSPWLAADSGGDFALGSVTFRRPINDDTQPIGVIPAGLGDYSLFANNVLVEAGETVSFLTQVFGSRILVSYQNFPEIFDNPLAQVDSQSDSAIDINPDDGEDITAVIPFFGNSAFGAAQNDGVLVVFKRNSVYLVNLAAKRAGQNPLQRIESQNLGCTAPYSVCAIRDGILFANEAGIYKLNKDATVRYMGRRLQRYWRQIVNRNSLDTVQATNWAFTNKILVSVPTGSEIVPNKAWTYDITREYAPDGFREGSWVRYENFPAIGYCNLGEGSFLCDSKGRVFTRRNLQEPSDYRDDSAAIVATATLRPMSFGDSGIRKSVPYATITYRNTNLSEGAVAVTVRSSVDLSDSFEDSDPVTLPRSEQTNDLSDTLGRSGETVRQSFHEKKGVYFQLQIENAEKDQGLEVTGIQFKVAGLSDKGVQQAAQTTRTRR